MTGDPQPWSPTGPLTPGITLIEASAGTGKTYNITSLLVRLVAEQGVRIDRILVVTYTRAATAELEERIRGRLVAAVDALTGEERPGDAVLAHLWDVAPDARALRVRRLRDAVESFDQALISTIHGFCQRMLQQNAFESGVSFDLELAPDADRLIEELVDDHLARAFYDADADRVAFLRGHCGFLRDKLKKLASTALDDPDTRVVPTPDDVDAKDWPRLVAGLAAEWSAMADHFVGHVADQAAAAKAGGGVLKKGQRKYNEKKAREWVDGITAWLDSDPPLGSLPPEPELFTPATMAGQLADPSAPLTHPCLEQVEALCGFPARVAGSLRAAFVAEIRERFEARKDRRRIQTYQDLLRGLARRLHADADPADRQALTDAIGGTFDAALIDEFQDTDDHQWTIFSGVFGHGRHHLYLIGDPKQAIYGFRGANVHVYTTATQHAGHRRFTMATNWRSDRRLLSALNHLLDQPGSFGPSVGFGYVPVDAPEGRGGDGLRPPGGFGSPESAPLQLRWLDGELIGEDLEKPISKGALSGLLERRVAEDVVALLVSGTEVDDGGWRPVRPADVAVLVRKGRQAVAIQEALAAVGVPAVLSGAASVLASDEALEVQHWLAALAEPAGGSAARVVASTRLFGWPADALLAVEEEEPAAVARWDGWLGRIASWRELMQRKGFVRALRRALDDEGVTARLLALADGERRVTNLLHVVELVHAAETRQRLAPGALLTWLTQRRSDGDLDSGELELRLDRDAEAVRILTMHKAKGLEFPICFVPYLWDGGQTRPSANDPLVLPDPADRERRLLDVGLPTDAAHRAQAEREAKEEGLRLAYVALTRARHRCVVYAGLVADFEHSPLAAILHGSGPDRLASGAAQVREGALPLRADVEEIAAASAHGVSVLPCDPPIGLRYAGEEAAPPALSTRRFQRGPLDPGWRRHSYTSLSRAAGHPELVEDGKEGFDPDAEDVSGPVAPEASPVEVPLAAFPGGADAGTLLHEVFEKADFAWADPQQPRPDLLTGVVADRLTVHGFDAERYTALLTTGLSAALATPLGGPLGDLRLCDVPTGDRLDEMRFDMPVLGGTSHRGDADALAPARGITAAIRSRADDRLPKNWLESLDRLDGVQLAGFLTGSIDLVFRGPDGRWFVADYKSNRIDPGRIGRCVPEAFTDGGMTQEMARHDYFLQYHLYLVALHRFLRWRIADYDYDRHVGGVYYLFFRGMVGPETERDGEAVRGCWFDRPPREVVERLDRALDPDTAGGGT